MTKSFCPDVTNPEVLVIGAGPAGMAATVRARENVPNVLVLDDNPALGGQKEYTRVLALSGGLPIKVGDDVVGAVGVSGSPGKDDDCSKAGIDKVADQLK